MTTIAEITKNSKNISLLFLTNGKMRLTYVFAKGKS